MTAVFELVHSCLRFVRYNRMFAFVATFTFFCVVLCLRSSASSNSCKVNLPEAGRRSRFEPTWLLRLRFVRSSRSIIKDGYTKYRDAFIVRRRGADTVLIGSHRLIEEIRAQTRDSARSVQAFLVDFHTEYTRGEVFVTSDLQNRVLQQKVTPNLGILIPIIKEELDHALEKEMPQSKETEWTELDPLKVFPKIIARIITRLILGPGEKHKEEWVKISAQFSRNVFLAGFALRFSPRLLRPLVAVCLPSLWNLHRNYADAWRIVRDLVDLEKPVDDEMRETHSLLHWTLEMANAEESTIDNLSRRMLIMALAGIHTTALTMAQALFDLVEHPKHLSIIREELTQVLAPKAEWSRSALSELVKLDSLLKESQRISPVFQVGFTRFLLSPVTLSNGLHLPAGTRIAAAQHAIANDPGNVPGEYPDSYNPWRYVDLRSNPANANKYQFATVDATHMGFGYGKYACPGRAFVSNEIKMVLAHLLLRYEFRYPKAKSRPVNYTVDSDMYPEMSARVLMRRREVEREVRHIVGAGSD